VLHLMYGLKPVPFTLPVFTLKPVPFTLKLESSTFEASLLRFPVVCA
jgi:hypothetical protein